MSPPKGVKWKWKSSIFPKNYRKGLFEFYPEKQIRVGTILVLNRDGKIHFNDYNTDRSRMCGSSNGAEKYRSINVGKIKKYKCEVCHRIVERTEWAHLKDNTPLLVSEMCKPCHQMYDAITGEDILLK